MYHIRNKFIRKKSKYSKTGNLVWAFRKLWHIDWHFVFLIFASIPVAIILPLVNSYFAKILIDNIGSGAEFGELFLLTLGFTAAFILLDILDNFLDSRRDARRYYPTLIYQYEMNAMQNCYYDFENTERQDFKEIRGYAIGDAKNGNCALEFFGEDISNTCCHVLGIVTYVSFLSVLNPFILAAVVMTSILSFFTTRWQAAYYEKHKSEWEKESRKKDYLQGLSGDFSKAKDIKLYGLEGWINQMMRTYQTYILMWVKRCSLRGLWASLLAGLMTLLQDGIAYFALIGILLNGGITVGEFVFYFGLVASTANFLQSIIGDIAKLGIRAEKIAYYRDYYDYPNHFNHGEGCSLPKASVRIELKDVWFRYDGAEEDTLKGINLVIEGGESLALVGVNGAGKTTLIKLLCGLYVPTKGEILVGGKRIEEYNIDEYYSLISAVFQEIQAVAFTLFEFVASSDLERPAARVDAISAMKAAGIYEKVETLKHGMDTHLMKSVYDDGVDLSGGEMQKLVLARAIYKNGSILVLDEPTAALDPIAENKLYMQYRALTKGKTSIYISHRFASTRFCDRIVLLEGGRIVESGTHDELMCMGGKYAYMFGVQSKYYQEGKVNA